MNSFDIPVFLFPFAGANRNSYRILEAALERAGLKGVPLELPGHGARIAEPLCGDIAAMEEDLLRSIAPHGADPFVLFGHSMGGLLAYRLALRLSQQGNAPLCLVVSGRAAPSVPLRRPPIHALGHEAFIEEIRRLGGSPEEILNDREAMEFFAPILRADFRATETYRHAPAPPLQVPLTVIIGAQDTVAREDAARWGELTDGRTQLTIMEGGHFHILNRPDETARIIRHSIHAAL